MGALRMNVINDTSRTEPKHTGTLILDVKIFKGIKTLQHRLPYPTKVFLQHTSTDRSAGSANDAEHSEHGKLESLNPLCSKTFSPTRFSVSRRGREQMKLKIPRGT